MFLWQIAVSLQTTLYCSAFYDKVLVFYCQSHIFWQTTSHWSKVKSVQIEIDFLIKQSSSFIYKNENWMSVFHLYANHTCASRNELVPTGFAIQYRYRRKLKICIPNCAHPPPPQPLPRSFETGLTCIVYLFDLWFSFLGL